jgi:hypothetical protein
MEVNGIAGVFVYANDPKKLAEWYARHFGADLFCSQGVVKGGDYYSSS